MNKPSKGSAIAGTVMNKDDYQTKGGGNAPVIIDGSSLILTTRKQGQLSPDHSSVSHVGFNKIKKVYLSDDDNDVTDNWQIMISVQVNASATLHRVVVDATGIKSLSRGTFTEIALKGKHNKGLYKYVYEIGQAVEVEGVDLKTGTTDPSTAEVTLDGTDANYVNITFDQ
jgi:hypothetical protein